MKPMVTIRELAKQIGLSPTTVSMVLNSAPLARHIPEETKHRVREGAKKFGYSPNPFARYLRSNRSATVALLLSDITDPYCAAVLRGIDSSLYPSHYIPVLLDIQNSRARFKHNLQKLVDRRIEGIIGIANSLLLQTALLTTIEKHRIPIVLIGRDMAGTEISSVSIENEVGAYQAVKHLYELGHRKIAFLKGPKEIVDSAQRWKGIKQFANEVGLTIDPKLIVPLHQPGTSHEGGFEATKELIRRKKEFTALLAFDDLTAFGAIRALTQTGRSVPSNCSVIGFDDIAAAAFYNPPITTVRQPMEKLGASAVEIFFEGANAFFAKTEFTPIHRAVKPKLVIRDSTSQLRPYTSAAHEAP
jgi:LacI family transcriptional regulator